MEKDDILLSKPKSEYAMQIAEYRQEFLDAGDSMDGCGSLRQTDETLCIFLPVCFHNDNS